ncbi:uncharacterized protein FIESC28_07748 [Fusarium coffeatum]|uniref:Uncharacterized protein n=1 Tax=Fusarium coffeatum TaxID=231269 RepID=A0A366RCL5_9HYPO|nr:uncharacterized protein FIESC28_07748 [Fusarium coffeatum]RBR14318.1 hypothetical protein FIESC28_07748 [Fusarium coffeatum]
MFWQPKFYDTAKVPASYRRIILFDAEKLHAALQDMLGVALYYATEEAIQLYAMAIPLPDEEDTEDEDFESYEGSLDDDEYLTMHTPENVASDPYMATTTSEPIWNGAVDSYDWPNVEEPIDPEPCSNEEGFNNSDNADFDPFESAANQDTPEAYPWITNAPESSYNALCDDFASFLDSRFEDNGEAHSNILENSPSMHRNDGSSWQTNDPIASHEETCSDIWYDTGRSHSDDHCVPFAHDGPDDKSSEKSADDSESSDEMESEEIDDGLEKLELGDNTLFHPVEYYWPTHFMQKFFPKATEYGDYVTKKDALVETITKNKALSPAEVDLILRTFVHENMVRKPTVDCTQLFKMKRFVDNAERLVFALQRNIDAIDADVIEGRRRHHMGRDSPLLRRRSKGLRSSLRFVTSVDDEEELGEDNWGLSPVMKQRQLI